MNKTNYKKIIKPVVIVLIAIGLIVAIGFISEAIRQNSVKNKVYENIKGLSYYGEEAGSDFYLLLAFSNEESKKLVINFATEDYQQYYLTFDGTYELYYDGRNLMMDVTYQSDELEYKFLKEKFTVKLDSNRNVTSLINIDEEGNTTTLYLDQ